MRCCISLLFFRLGEGPPSKGGGSKLEEEEMKKYRKKPIVVEAEQWFKVTYDREAGHGNEPEDMPTYHLGVDYYRRPEPEYSGDRLCPHCESSMHVHGWIDTLEGGHVVCPKDWIIRGIQGELYPCKPDIFEKTYEPFGQGENN